MTRRRSLSTGLAALVAIAGLAGIGTASVAAAEPDPVLLVHGYRGSPSTWNDMVARFASEGRTAVAIDLPSEDNVVNARAIQISSRLADGRGRTSSGRAWAGCRRANSLSS